MFVIWYCAVSRIECQLIREIAKARDDKLSIQPLAGVPKRIEQFSNGQEDVRMFIGKIIVLLEIIVILLVIAYCLLDIIEKDENDTLDKDECQK